jgi:hypothetical protein
VVAQGAHALSATVALDHGADCAPALTLSHRIARYLERRRLLQRGAENSLLTGRASATG